MAEKNTLLAIKYNSESKTLSILDQLKLPHRSEYIDIHNTKDGFDAIKSMTVRGAPAIAIVAVLSLVVELSAKKDEFRSAEEVAHFVKNKLEYLVTSRPTAVNLSRAAKDLSAYVDEEKSKNNEDSNYLVYKVIAFGEKMLEDDVADNKNIGKYGSEWAIKQLIGDNSNDGKFSVLTICNTGSLATAGYGTALGIIRSLFYDHADKVDHTFACETRPYNQGSRLTAYELVYEKIPSTLITDNMVASLLQSSANGTNPNTTAPVRLIVVGADRVARNGDTANKIGTFQLAALANFFNNYYKDEKDEGKRKKSIKFVVAAPTTSIDLNTPSGDKIVIEQRPSKELVEIKGPVVDTLGSGSKEEFKTISVAAPGIQVWNPAFDVTPYSLIDAIVTEKGVAEKDESGNFNLDKFFS